MWSGRLGLSLFRSLTFPRRSRCRLSGRSRSHAAPSRRGIAGRPLARLRRRSAQPMGEAGNPSCHAAARIRHWRSTAAAACLRGRRSDRRSDETPPPSHRRGRTRAWSSADASSGRSRRDHGDRQKVQRDPGDRSGNDIAHRDHDSSDHQKGSTIRNGTRKIRRQAAPAGGRPAWRTPA